MINYCDNLYLFFLPPMTKITPNFIAINGLYEYFCLYSYIACAKRF